MFESNEFWSSVRTVALSMKKRELSYLALLCVVYGNKTAGNTSLCINDSCMSWTFIRFGLKLPSNARKSSGLKSGFRGGNRCQGGVIVGNCFHQVFLFQRMQARMLWA